MSAGYIGLLSTKEIVQREQRGLSAAAKDFYFGSLVKKARVVHAHTPTLKGDTEISPTAKE